MRGTPDPLTYFRALADKPFNYDFFQALRRIECLHPDKPKLGMGLRPIDEAVRLAQEPSMIFAPSSLSSFYLPAGGRRILQDASGYKATIVSGVVTRRDDRDTGARPGRLVRAGS